MNPVRSIVGPGPTRAQGAHRGPAYKGTRARLLRAHGAPTRSHKGPGRAQEAQKDPAFKGPAHKAYKGPADGGS